MATLARFARMAELTRLPDVAAGPGGVRVRHRRHVRPLLLLSAALCAPLVVLGLAGQAWSETLHPAPRPAPLAYGFQGDFFQTASRPQAIAAIKGAGFGWAKQQVQWSDYEIPAAGCAANHDDCLEQSIGGRTKYFRKSQVGFLDAVVDALSGAGLDVLLSVVRAPDFYAAPGGHSPADPADLRDFLQFLATRYKGKVHAIEPWNEQNLAWEWGGQRLWPNAPAAPPQGVVDFIALQKAAYQGIKTADPGITVVLPALTPTGYGECWLDEQARSQGFCLDQVHTALDDRLYLDFLFQVNGGEIKNYYDVLGVHPSGYNNPPDDWVDRKTVPTTSFKGHGSFYIKRYQQLHDLQVKYGDPKPMWFTEVGWSSTTQSVPGYEYGRDNTEAARGAYVARLLEQVNGEAPYVTNVFLWNLNFRTLVPEADEKYGFGLLNADGSATSGYTCAADFVRSGNQITRAECRLASAAAPPATAAPTSAPAATPTSTATTPTATSTAAPSATTAPSATPTSTATIAPSVTPTATPAATATAPPATTATAPPAATQALATASTAPSATFTTAPVVSPPATAAATVTSSATSSATPAGTPPTAAAATGAVTATPTVLATPPVATVTPTGTPMSTALPTSTATPTSTTSPAATTALVWTTPAAAPAQRASVGAAVIGGKLYAVRASSGPGEHATVTEYDPVEDHWASRAGMPSARYNFAVAAAINGRLYAVGGRGGAGVVATVEEYDPATDTWKTRASMPTARERLTVAASSAGKLYAIGGQSAGGYLAAVEEYDPATDRWTTKASMPAARAGLAAATSYGAIYVAGGEAAGAAVIGTMEAYDPAADTWKTLAPLPAPRRDLALAAAGGRLYAIGGSAVVGGQCCAGVATVEEFDPASGSWAARAPLAVVPEALAAASYGRLYVLGASAASTVLTLQQATITG